MLVFCKHEIRRDNLLALLCQGGLQKRMPSLVNPQRPVLRQNRHSGPHSSGTLSLGADEIHLSDELCPIHKFRNIRPQEIGELHKDAGNLPLAVECQAADTVVEFHHFHRFYEEGLAGCGSVLDDTRNASLAGGVHRNEHLAIPYRYGSILIRQIVSLCFFQKGFYPSADGTLGLAELGGYFVKFSGCRILYQPVLVQDGIYLGIDCRIILDGKSQSLKERIFLLLCGRKERGDAPEISHKIGELLHVFHRDGAALLLQRREKTRAISKAPLWELALHNRDLNHFIHQSLTTEDFFRI